MSNYFTSQIEMKEETCWICGIHFAMPTRWAKRRRENGKGFQCPAGCRLKYVDKTVENQLREELEMKERALAHSRSRAERLERSNSALRGAHTRTKKRIANGVCPCCKRNFKNLHRHMKGQHPEYAVEEEK